MTLILIVSITLYLKLMIVFIMPDNIASEYITRWIQFLDFGKSVPTVN